MTSLPLVSVVMPVRNGARFLNEAVATVLVQTLVDLELVVVDDGSSDETPDLLRHWQRRDARVRVIRRDGPGGVAVALREGIGQAEADLLARLDADDRAAPERLARQVEVFRIRPALGLLGTGARFIDDRGRTVQVVPGRSGPVAADELRRGNVIFHPSVMMRRSAYEAVGGYRPQMEPAEDFDLWLRIAERWDVDNLGDPLIDYRLHGGQSGVLNLRAQATASAAARWSAEVRASGSPDPAEDLDQIDEAVLLARGVSATALREQRFEAYRWAARTYERAGYADVGRLCWRAARTEASALGRVQEGRLLLHRAGFRRWQGRRAAAFSDQVRAAIVAPRLLLPGLSRRLRRP